MTSLWECVGFHRYFLRRGNYPTIFGSVSLLQPHLNGDDLVASETLVVVKYTTVSTPDVLATAATACVPATQIDI